MNENPRFKIVFAKLQAALEEDAQKEILKGKAVVRLAGEVSSEEFDEIDDLRRIVLETTTPEPMLFTTT